MIKTLHLVSSLVVLMFAVTVTTPQVAHAQEAPDTNQQPAEEKEKAPENYTYITPEGCSLSLLSRRSLQLYDESNEDVTLSKAATIYAETNIVQQMGPRLLDVGERVEIPYELVDRYASSSQDLSARILALWDQYASRARFELSNIKTVAQTAAEDKAADEAANGSAKPADNPSEQANPDNASATAPERSNNLWWALLIGAGVYAAWVIANRRRQTSDK